MMDVVPGLSPEAAETLAAVLVEEMIQQWRQGNPLLPEFFLDRYPDLLEHPAAAAELIYEECCLREEFGPEMPLDEVLGRFPQWRPQLEVLLDCQRLLTSASSRPLFPAVGETLGDFLLLGELGCGAHGRVFLASQLSLSNRPVVLKLTPCDGREDLSLARLQHTHIVPLYTVEDHPQRRLRALCLPYFGGATLAQVLESLRRLPPADRTGNDVLDAMDKFHAATPLTVPARGPARQFLATASYVDAICWIGACLADALHYAHERDLIHLDLKPSNLLLAADGQPMVLDFHLAREPIGAQEAMPPWLGGTPGYMSPEQRAALSAAKQGGKIPAPVNRHSDIYSLGLVLFEALAGQPAINETRSPAVNLRSLRRRNSQVSVGLSDVIGKCLTETPAARYPDMACLAADLRRHLAQQPLVGVSNRSLAERWQKWRRRRPHRVVLAGMLIAVLGAASAVTIGTVSHFTQRIEMAHAALDDGRLRMASGDWEGAVNTLDRGRSLVGGVPFQRQLTDALARDFRHAEQGLNAAKRAAAAHKLHQLAERIRLVSAMESLPAEGHETLDARCRALWHTRNRIVDQLGNVDEIVTQTVREDLFDLAIFWADLQLRVAEPADKDKARHKAIALLDQAEASLGSCPALRLERQLYGGSRGDGQSTAGPAWDHYSLSRTLLKIGKVQEAAQEAHHAVLLRPHAFWPNFYVGLCASRQGRNDDAAMAFSVCIGSHPDAAIGYLHRGNAFAALGRSEQARADYEHALRLEPALALPLPAKSSK